MKTLTHEELKEISTHIYEKHFAKVKEENPECEETMGLAILKTTLDAVAEYLEEYQKRVQD